MTRAIVYVPPLTEYAESAASSFAHLHACGYEFKGVVRDWATAMRMMGTGEVSVVIVNDRRELLPDRKPRVEFVSHSRPRWQDERTRIIRRDGGA
jgi:hypothetical protein